MSFPNAINLVLDFNSTADEIVIVSPGINDLAAIERVRDGNATLPSIDGTSVALLIGILPNNGNANNVVFEGS
ncbi:MAG: hypothetical protein AAF704_06835 [Cyanobacteria bacterium P01_D01_bin.123]